MEDESISKDNNVVDQASLSEALDSDEARTSENAQNVTDNNISATPIKTESFDQVGVTFLPVSLISLEKLSQYLILNLCIGFFYSDSDLGSG